MYVIKLSVSVRWNFLYTKSSRCINVLSLKLQKLRNFDDLIFQLNNRTFVVIA